ncbi:MAG: hypothetical protein KDA79_05405 [Planctomycetaceae bacterium]|nr:hypothetical protein [Planctomycetaceae bacterium]
MKRILLYCQSMLGSGHFVRMALLARGLSEEHAVVLMDGGRPVSSEIFAPRVSRLELPPIWNCQGQVVPFASSASLAEVMSARFRRLESATRELPWDAIVVEHFPFSKWFLRDEILPLLQLARQLNPQVQIIGSVRDLLPVVNESISPQSRRDRVVRVLGSRFHALLIHSDPQFLALNGHLPWVSDIRIPMHYTGYISRYGKHTSDAGYEQTTDLSSPARSSSAMPPAARSGVLVSAGGDGGALLRKCCIEAWKQLHYCGEVDTGHLTVVLPPEPEECEIRKLQQAVENLPIRIERFSAEFPRWMQQSQLSISQAGYNTCSDLLGTCTRSILVPHPRSEDQPLRARRFAESGLATTLSPQELSGPAMAEAIRVALSLPAPRHGIDLNGVARSCEIINQLLQSGG